MMYERVTATESAVRFTDYMQGHVDPTDESVGYFHSSASPTLIPLINS
jgi:hypothetical protein